jgi:hypothetical protein
MQNEKKHTKKTLVIVRVWKIRALYLFLQRIINSD